MNLSDVVFELEDYFAEFSKSDIRALVRLAYAAQAVMVRRAFTAYCTCGPCAEFRAALGDINVDLEPPEVEYSAEHNDHCQKCLLSAAS